MNFIKKISLASLILFSGISIYAQNTDQARDASVMIDKENRNAVMITIDQPEKITREALKLRMERSGLTDKIKNGVMSYKGVTLSEISTDKVDIYTKVEKGPNNSSVVYMAVSRGYNNFSTTSVDSNITQNVKTFLQSFVKDADYHSADIGISNQIDDLAKEEKSYQKLLDEQRDLQKKKSNIENRLVEIQSELQKRETELDKKKSGVEDAKSKRSNIKN
jgi:peptidoglycan hydrolase CwlO-like protein